MGLQEDAPQQRLQVSAGQLVICRTTDYGLASCTSHQRQPTPLAHLTLSLPPPAQDEAPYVRTTAAVCVAKLYDINAELVEDRGFLDMLKVRMTVHLGRRWLLLLVVLVVVVGAGGGFLDMLNVGSVMTCGVRVGWACLLHVSHQLQVGLGKMLWMALSAASNRLHVLCC